MESWLTRKKPGNRADSRVTLAADAACTTYREWVRPRVASETVPPTRRPPMTEGREEVWWIGAGAFHAGAVVVRDGDGECECDGEADGECDGETAGGTGIGPSVTGSATATCATPGAVPARSASTANAVPPTARATRHVTATRMRT
jgi:hypothetical protein